MKTMTADEKRWRAEDDARTVLRAEEIMNNSGRKKAMAAILKEQAKAAAKAARRAGF